MTNYDETRVPAYTLPPLLTMADGSQVTDAATWHDKRRPELLALFADNVWGDSPAFDLAATFAVVAEGEAFDGLATRKIVAVRVGGATFHLLVYVPGNAATPCPAFLGFNFLGNHTISDDPDVPVIDAWRKESDGTVRRLPLSTARGEQAHRWQIPTVLGRGYAVATAFYEEVEPDIPGGNAYGIRAGLAAGEAGAIATWARAMSLSLDFLETAPDIDARRVALVGHSRLGKAALCAGAQDTRFALVIANNSGESGAALARRRFGETIADSSHNFPHWFHTRYGARFAGNESALPVDAHSLLALIAPRPLYIATAAEDLWADPRGEFLAAQAAQEVYDLWNKNGLTGATFPEPDAPIGDPGGALAFHRRSGKHDVTADDWRRFLDFADHHLV